MTVPDRLTFSEWQAGLERGVLLGQTCRECGETRGSPTAACPFCGARTLETVELPTTGTVYTETTITVPPAGVEASEYQVALVSVGDARITARVDGEPVTIGDEVAFTDVVRGEDGTLAPVVERDHHRE